MKTIWMKPRNSLHNFVALSQWYAFVNTMGRREMKNSRCFRPAFGGGGGGGGSSTFWKWHCLRKIALESKRLIHTRWTWCQITSKRIFYPIQEKSMAFNQECRWNYGSKSLHSFWATLYIKGKLQLKNWELGYLWMRQISKIARWHAYFLDNGLLSVACNCQWVSRLYFHAVI